MEQAKKQEGLAQAQLPEKDTVARGFFWFVAQGSLLKGPYSTNELKKLIDKKDISEKFFAWRDGFKEWRPLYSIEELNIEKQVESVYPSVPVPGHGNAASTDFKINQRATPIYKVRFSRSRWTDLRKSEVVGLFLISLSFTLCFLYLSIDFFQKEWSQVWGKRVSGIPVVMGQAPDAVPLYMLNPLLSAPGLKHQEENWVAIEAETNLNHYAPQNILGMKLETNLPIDDMQSLVWDKSNTYSRRLRVQGYINLKDPTVIRVEQRGLPYLPSVPAHLPPFLSK